ncbi:MAG: molybdopterin-dependent oxidoreductase, partial [Chloroflexota bacterium]
VAKPFALLGGLVLLALLAALAGAAVVLAVAPDKALARTGVICLAAAIQATIATLVLEPGRRPEDWVPGAVLYGAWLGAMVLVSPAPVQPPAGHAPGRRRFLTRSVQAFAGFVAFGTLASLTLLLKTLAGARPGRPIFAFSAPAARNPAFAAVPALSPEVTPVASFYLMSKTVSDPTIAPEAWRLRVTGLVRRPLELTYADLTSLPRVDQWMTLRCVSNPVGGPLIGNGYWSGVLLPWLLAQAGVEASAATVVLKAADGYADSLPLERALMPTTLVAYAVDGELLNRDHGFPSRVLVPGLYGFKNVKWVEELRLLAGDFPGPWRRLGWTSSAIQGTFSRIDFVRPEGQGAMAAGVAFAGDRGIRAVQVRVGRRPWANAELNAPPLGPLAWVQWLYRFSASGPTTVTVRAVDGTGAMQEETRHGVYPNGASGWHSITVDLRSG